MRLPALFTLALHLVGDPNAAAQDAGARPAAAGAAITGAVHDSLARRPLAGALVQLVSAGEGASVSRAVTADSLGRFRFDSVPAGRYAVGFLHPVLDSLGIESPARQVTVAHEGTVQLDLATPSPARLRGAVCGPPDRTGETSGRGSIIVGFVRDARDGRPVANADVTVEWLELTFSKTGVHRRNPRLVSTSWSNGWFFLCDVPRPGVLDIVGSHGADSTDRLEVHMPEAGFVRLDLYLAPPRAIAAAGRDSSSGGRVERLSGVVRTLDGLRPLGGAEVRLADGSRTRTNERGEWTFSNVAAGTQMLEVRAVGFYPERRPVNVVAPGAPLHVELATLRTVLDTVRVRTTRLADAGFTGFETRRHTMGTGRFLTPVDIKRLRPQFFSSILMNMAGVKLEWFEGSRLIRFRGQYADWCSPAIWVEGQYQGELSADELDAWIDPKRVVGLEVYAGSVVPQEFSRGMAGAECGSLVIWTR